MFLKKDDLAILIYIISIIYIYYTIVYYYHRDSNTKKLVQ